MLENPWVPWYPADYIGKTRHLTTTQHGVYTLLLWEYYINGPIDARGANHGAACAQQVLNMCSAHKQHEIDDVAFVLSEFFVVKDGKYHHERADEEIARREDIRKKRVMAGKARAAHAQHMLSTRSHNNNNNIRATPPTPLSGGPNRKLTPREVKRVTNEMQKIAKARIGAKYDLAEALETACVRAGVEFERARYMLNEETT